MKKIFLSLLIITASAGAMVSCKKDKATDCSSLAKKVSDAGTAYVSDMNAANCKTYKAALQEYLNSDCVTGISAEQKAVFQASLDGLNCDQP